MRHMKSPLRGNRVFQAIQAAVAETVQGLKAAPPGWLGPLSGSRRRWRVTGSQVFMWGAIGSIVALAVRFAWNTHKKEQAYLKELQRLNDRVR